MLMFVYISDIYIEREIEISTVVINGMQCICCHNLFLNA